jgi:putative transport protein
MGLGPLETFGGICGAMTSTPGLGAVTASIDSSLPATSYATVYPLALILVTILAPILVTHL